MQLRDIVKRVQFKCDDPDGTYIDDDYVSGFAQEQYEKLQNKLRLAGANFDKLRVEIPGVQAGLPDLTQYMITGQPLATLITPSQIEWKLPGLDPSNYVRANGPLDQVIDIPGYGVPALTSWSWERRNIKLSKTSTALDFRVSGSFMFDPLEDEDSVIAIDLSCNVALACMIASEVGKARGNDKWAEQYAADFVDAFDDLFITWTKANQAKTRRVRRMSRPGGLGSTITVGGSPAI